jgi:hypothetical protein
MVRFSMLAAGPGKSVVFIDRGGLAAGRGDFHARSGFFQNCELSRPIFSGLVCGFYELLRDSSAALRRGAIFALSR